MFRLVVAGSRGFKNYYEAKKILLSVLSKKNLNEVCIVSGGARGADAIGEEFAKEFGCSLAIYPADWKTHGKRAGHIRNEVMARNSDATILFWDGDSSGTANMHSNTLAVNNPLFVVYYNPIGQSISYMQDESNPF